MWPAIVSVLGSCHFLLLLQLTVGQGGEMGEGLLQAFSQVTVTAVDGQVR